MTDAVDIAERFELASDEVEDDVYATADQVVTCIECDAILEHEEMILGAWCGNCRPEFTVERVPESVRRRYRGCSS
jgi:hypothetical protein